MYLNYYLTFNSKESQDVSLEQVASIIGHDEELKKSTQLHRELLAQGHNQAAKDVKEQTPQVARELPHGGRQGQGQLPRVPLPGAH